MIIRLIILLLSLNHGIFCTKAETENDDSKLNVEYAHYLKQVIDTLETDPLFKAKLETMPNDTNILGVADYLELVSHGVRTKLDELKRLEIDRLNKLENRLEKLHSKSSNSNIRKVDKEHINLYNDFRFEEEDLKKLISKTVESTKKLDKEAEEEYRRYLMEKEMLRRMRLSKIKSKEMREKQRLLEEQRIKRHNQHKPIHHPGSEEQLKEVWEKDDKLDPSNFEPITFFKLHDSNGDGHLDVAEVEAIMQVELTKAYDKNNSDDDLVEMFNELRRMRKEVFLELDTNKDMMISFSEYMAYVKSPSFKENEDWKTESEANTTQYSTEQFDKFAQEFEKKHPDVNFKEIKKIHEEEISPQL